MLAIVNFHYIRHSFAAPYASIYGITPSYFERQLLTYAKYSVFIGGRELSDLMQKGEPVRGNRLLITFDDGLKEQYELAYPILIKHGVPAVFFINTRSLMEKTVADVHKIHLVRSLCPSEEILGEVHNILDGRLSKAEWPVIKSSATMHYKYDDLNSAELKYLLNFTLSLAEREILINQLFARYFPDEEYVSTSLYMDAEHIRELGNLGYVGSHGHDHIPMGMLSNDQKDFHVRQSKEILEFTTGTEVSAFSYPYGSKESCRNMDEVLGKNNYTFAVTMTRGLNIVFDKPFHLNRYDNNDLPLGKTYRYTDNNFFKMLKD